MSHYKDYRFNKISCKEKKNIMKRVELICSNYY